MKPPRLLAKPLVMLLLLQAMPLPLLQPPRVMLLPLLPAMPLLLLVTLPLLLATPLLLPAKLRRKQRLLLSNSTESHGRVGIRACPVFAG